MSSSKEFLGGVVSQGLSQLEPILQRFDEAWHQGRRPALEEYLAAGGGARTALLAELVHIELEYRLKAGEPVRVETYLHQYPELAADPTRVVQLIAAEYGLRRRREPGLTTAEYLARFPRLGVRLKEVLDSALTPTPKQGPATEDDSGTPTPPAAFLVPMDPGEWGVQVPGYEILGELGRGGMGVVYKARQEKLNRVVALKMILGGAQAGPEGLARFRSEAEAVACLRHPNIVQIYEVGEYQGLPYFALEYLEGGSLAQKLKGTPQPARLGAQLLETLARGIHLAHKQGVVHRDLKPANILLTDGAEPKVTDFGLARRFQEASGLTQTGAIVGTPSYMAPEQALGKNRGRPVGPAADIYSLGAILYEMLTGRPPFLGETPWDVVQQVLRQEVVPPGQLQPKVPRDLETICLKCLQKEPAKRYATAEQLAEDLRRFIEGRPIRGRPVGRGERLWRWCRRNPGMAGSLAAVGLILVAGTAVASWFAVQANANAGRADQKAAEAQANERRANEQSRLALKTLRLVVVDIQTKLTTIPGAQAVRQKLLLQAIAGLKEVAQTAETTAGKDQSLWGAHIEIGDLYLETGGAEKAEWTREALRNYQRALEIVWQWARADPNHSQIQRDLAVTYKKLGDVHLQLGNTPAARNFYQKNLDLTLARAKADPNNTQAQHELCVAYDKLGDAYRLLGNTPAAREAFHKSMDLALARAKADPKDAIAQQNLSVAYGRLGDVNLRLGNTLAARDAYQKGLDLALALAKATPNSNWAQRDLSVSYNKLGDVDLQRGNAAAARDAYQKALDLCRALAQADPNNPRAQHNLLVSYNKLVGVYLQLGNTPAARDASQKSLELALAQAQADPNNTQAQRDLACAYNKLGDGLLLGNTLLARDAYQKFRDLARALVKADPNNTQVQCDLVAAYHKLGDVHLRLGDTAAAREAYQNGQGLALTLVKADPNNTQAQRDLAVSYQRLGDVYLQLGDTPAAQVAFQKSLDLALALAKADPNNTQAQRDLAVSYNKLGDVDLKLGKSSSALDFYQKGLDLALALAKADPNNTQAQRDLAVSYERLGDIHLELGNLTATRNAYQKNLDLRLALAKADPNNTQAQRDISVSHNKLGDVNFTLGNTAAARDAYQKGLVFLARKLALNCSCQ